MICQQRTQLTSTIRTSNCYKIVTQHTHTEESKRSFQRPKLIAQLRHPNKTQYQQYEAYNNNTKYDETDLRENNTLLAVGG